MNKIEFSEYISGLAIKAILYELATTPKPGLVDRKNAGAHSDMDIFTFLSSASVLGLYFYNCTLAGIDFRGEYYKDLLRVIRPMGIKAEKDMFNSTCGVNTHKGIIFSQGITASAVGSLYREKEILNITTISQRVKKIADGITEELNFARDKKVLTYGERLFMEYGIKGIRGEVEEGFPTIKNYSYPLIKRLMEEKNYHINDIMLHTLLYLIKGTEDSNILGRHNMKVLETTKRRAEKAIKLGGAFTKEGKEYIKEMDKGFIKENISPGGSADLLSVSLMIYMIEKGDIYCR